MGEVLLFAAMMANEGCLVRDFVASGWVILVLVLVLAFECMFVFVLVFVFAVVLLVLALGVLSGRMGWG